MGLDWVPLGSPLSGHESEFQGLFEYLCKNPDRYRRSGGIGPWFRRLLRRGESSSRFEGRSDTELWRRFEEISISPHVTLGSPRIGFDRGADQWLAESYESSDAKQNGHSLDEVRKALSGSHVAELAPQCPGLSRFTMGSTGGYVEAYSFRAQMLSGDAMAAIIGKTASARAWASFLPEELIEYGAELELAAQNFAKAKAISRNVLVLRDDELSDDEDTLAVLLSAAQWCRYWGQNGHAV